MDDAEWKKKLSKAQYNVLRCHATEAPFSGEFLDKKDNGTYVCGACGQELFHSDKKYESTEPGLIGWPSFSDVLKKGAVKIVDDNSAGMKSCARNVAVILVMFLQPMIHQAEPTTV